MVDPGYIDEDGVLATAPEAWVALASVVTSSAVSHVTFASNYSSGGAGSGSPAGSLVYGVQNWSQYIDLVLITYSRGGASADYDNGRMRFNNISDNVYDKQYFNGQGDNGLDGNVATGGTSANIRSVGTNASTSEFGGGLYQIMDINSSKWKTMISRQAGNIGGGVGFSGVRCMQAKIHDPITEIDVEAASGNWTVGSGFWLFGILPAMSATRGS